MNERILQLIDYYELSVSSFERKINASDGVIRKSIANNTDIQSKWIKNISDNFPNINLEWLITGKGEMLKKDGSSQPKDPSLKEVLDRLEERGNELALLKRDYEEVCKENEALKKELQAKRVHSTKHE